MIYYIKVKVFQENVEQKSKILFPNNGKYECCHYKKCYKKQHILFKMVKIYDNIYLNQTKALIFRMDTSGHHQSFSSALVMNGSVHSKY